MQLAKLDYALGGTIVMDGFPLPPLFDMVGHSQSAARANATYYGTDMKWMIWHGESDPIFPVDLTLVRLPCIELCTQSLVNKAGCVTLGRRAV